VFVFLQWKAEVFLKILIVNSYR